MKIYQYIRTAIYLALAALVLVFIEHIVENLRYWIGGLMIFYGLEEIVYTFLRESKHYSLETLYWNLVEILIGTTLIIFAGKDPQTTYAVVCVTWATWSILRESNELMEATKSFGKHASVIPDIIESLVAIGFSVTMLIEPTAHHAKIHLYLLTVELATKVLFPHLNYCFRKRKRHAPDATEQIAEQIEEGEHTDSIT